MKRWMLDSGIANDLMNKREPVESRVRAALARGDHVGIATPVLGELRAGIENCRNREGNLRLLVQCLTRLRLWSFDKSAAEEFGVLQAELRRLGRNMQQIDVQIAAIAFALGNCAVVTKDSDLSRVPNLEVVDWSVA